MHVVVVGCGRVGTELSSLLEKNGHTVAIIDKNPKAFRERVKKDWGLTPYAFDVAAAAGGGGVVAGRVASSTRFATLSFAKIRRR